MTELRKVLIVTDAWHPQVNGVVRSIERTASNSRRLKRRSTARWMRPRNGQTIETVAIPDQGRMTLCISSQAGCALQCAFCATGRLGFTRHLQAWEIVAQVLAARAALEPGEQLRNVVFMGMGEPLHNYDNTMKAMRMLHAEEGLAISPRRITTV